MDAARLSTYEGTNAPQSSSDGQIGHQPEGVRALSESDCALWAVAVAAALTVQYYLVTEYERDRSTPGTFCT